MNRSRLPAALAGVLLLASGAVAALSAHDFWLVPNAFRVAPGGQIEVRGQTSSAFPTSEAAVTPDRLAEARIVSATQEARIREISVAGPSLLLRHRPGAAGQRIVAVRIHPRTVRNSAEQFREYLVGEGAEEQLERFEREGRLPTDSITRRFAKYAKTMLEVGRDGPRVYDRVLGHPSEFVPLSDPAALAPGGTLAVRYLYRGAPLAGAHVHVGSVPDLLETEPERSITLVTDAEGIVRVPIDRAGIWNVRAIHVVPADAGSGADWDAHWVTLVFAVEGRR